MSNSNSNDNSSSNNSNDNSSNNFGINDSIKQDELDLTVDSSPSEDLEYYIPSQTEYSNLIKTQLLNNSKMIYHDLYENRSTIYLYLKDKACVYCWYNTVTDEYYIGSTNSGKERLQAYLSPGRVAWAVEHPKDTHGINLRLARAITKYGYNGFLLLILEYIDKSNEDNSTIRSELISREQYYLDQYKPVYNFSTTAGVPNSLGKRLSSEHRAAIGKGITGRLVSPETREKIAATKRGELNPRYGYSPTQAEREAAILRMLKNNPKWDTGKPVYVWLSDKVTLYAEYVSIYQACKELNADNRTIVKYIDSGKLYRKTYYLTSTKDLQQ